MASIVGDVPFDVPDGEHHPRGPRRASCRPHHVGRRGGGRSRGTDRRGRRPRSTRSTRRSSGGATAEFERFRIELGIPRLGIDIDDALIPAGGVPRSGCGVVHEGLLHRPGARVSHRHPRPCEPLPAPTPDRRRCSARRRGDRRRRQGDRARHERGGDSPANTAPSRLAMVRREVEPPATVDLRWDTGTAVAQVV